MNNNALDIKHTTVAVVGLGNVGSHLAKALSAVCKVVGVPSRTLEGLPAHSDVILLCVKDDAIARVSAGLKGRADLLAHTSGSVPLSVLSGTASMTGVFYPMQTFSKGTAVDIPSVPFFIEGCSRKANDILLSLASALSRSVHEADSETRKRLHLAAVFACNFTNAMAAMASRVLEPTGLSIAAMLPLIDQTVAKLHVLDPVRAQTGPAARADRMVMDVHEQMLADEPELREIYSSVSNYIESHLSPARAKETDWGDN